MVNADPNKIKKLKRLVLWRPNNVIFFKKKYELKANDKERIFNSTTIHNNHDILH